MRNSNARVSSLKPARSQDWRRARGLHPDFPLFPLGDPDKPDRLRWAKKVRGKRHYFGTVKDDPTGQAALLLWLEQKDDLLAGRKPRSNDGLTITELCTRFLLSKQKPLESGELSPRT